MQCIAILRSGERCTRSARAGSPACSRHRRRTQSSTPDSFYADHLPRAEQQSLAQAAAVDGVSQEIASARTLLRRRAANDDMVGFCRGVDALVRLIRLQRTEPPPPTNLSALFEQSLDDLEAVESTHPLRR